MVSANKLMKSWSKEEAYKIVDIDTEDETIEVRVRQRFTIDDVETFCAVAWDAYRREVSEGVYDYHPALLNAVVRYLTLRLFTDIKFDEKKTLNDYFEWVVYSDVYDKVIEAMPQQYFELVDSLRNYIELKVAENNKSMLDVVAIKTLTSINRAVESFNANGIDTDAIEKLTSALSSFVNGGVSEDAESRTEYIAN